jgi:methoxymalonate biosynthesis protein
MQALALAGPDGRRRPAGDAPPVTALTAEDRLAHDVTDSPAAHRLAVLGAGTMGAGIAALASGHGLAVVLIDTDEAKLAQARARVAYQLRAARLMGALPERPAGRLELSSALAASAGSTALIEAVTELPALKMKALAEAAACVPPGTPLISNTSSIPVDELAAALDQPQALAGAHFMNPPYLIRQVEVIRGPRTSAETLAAVMGLLAAMNRAPIVVKDAAGFVTSRLLHPMINDAARIVGEGIASAADVDALLQGCLGHPTGPLSTADLIGLDNLVDSLNVLYERTGAAAFRPCEILLDKVRRGDLGRKSGKGFYEYGEA